MPRKGQSPGDRRDAWIDRWLSEGLSDSHIDMRQQGSYGEVCEEDWTEIGSAGVVGG